MIRAVQCEAADGAITGARVAGASGPALIFVHGVGSTAAIWDRQLEAFGDRFRCAAIELRGNGAFADPDPSLISRSGYATDVLTVADRLGMDRFTLVGCSLGGVVAFELWRRAPQRFDAMVILGSFARYPNSRQYVESIVAAVEQAGTMLAFAEQRATKLGLSPERLGETIDQMAAKSVPCYLAATQATWTGDYRAMLASIDVPALVACGEHDAVAPHALSQEIAAGIADAQLEVVPSAGHVANADNASAFNDLLRSFLDDGNGLRSG